MTDWNDPKSMVSRHFSVHECTWLPSWQCHHIPNDQEKANLTRQAYKMDEIRDLIGRPISIHCWIRPTKANCPGSPHDGQDYNSLVGGAPKSAHPLGLGTDWDANEDCDKTRATLLPHLDKLGIRMENHQGPWLHTDLMPPNPNRYFIP